MFIYMKHIILYIHNFIYLYITYNNIYLFLGYIAETARVLDPLILKERRVEHNTYG